LTLASTSVRAAGEPVSVPVIISLTGSFALLGNTQKLALETLMKTVNDEGGIDKQPLQFVFMDDGTNPATTVQFANQLIGRRVDARTVVGRRLPRRGAARHERSGRLRSLGRRAHAEGRVLVHRGLLHGRRGPHRAELLPRARLA
jgi:hypothetical protein